MQLSQQKFRLLVAEKAANNATKRSRLPVLPSRFLDVGAWHVQAVVRILGMTEVADQAGASALTGSVIHSQSSAYEESWRKFGLHCGD